MNGLSLVHISKSFGETRALAGVSFEIARGEIVAVLGPSGCGKSTLLGIIAGLLAPDEGEVLWDGKPLSGVPTYKRGFGLMFQDFALFPHRNVYDNVAFAMQMAHQPKEQIQNRVAEVLELVGLPGFARRDVNTLSGGEQQRVALARSLAPNPRLLMLDEPLGSLDRNLRERLVLELHQILRQMNQTALYVTHDQEEAFVLADRVVVMNAGQVQQVDTPQGIYLQPASIFVARFLGLNNLLPAEVNQRDGGRFAQTQIGDLPVPGQAKGQVTILIRPDTVHLNGEGDCQLQGRMVETSFRGNTIRATIEVKGVQMTFDFSSNARLPRIGEMIHLGFDPAEAIQVLAER